METTLHRQLKARYAASEARTEVCVEGYRIDAVVGEAASPVEAGEAAAAQLIEIQSASLGQIRTKVRRLLERHAVRVVKPIAARTIIVHTKRGREVSRRRSPKRGRLLDLFLDLVHFGDVFPHPRLVLDVVLIEQEEWRVARGGRRRWRRKDYRVLDRRLLAVEQTRMLRTAGDLWALLNCELPAPFTTAALADRLGEPRWMAQKIAYCLRQSGAVRVVGKHGNAWEYAVAGKEDVKAA